MSYPDPSNYKEGKILKNKKTNEAIIKRNGKWEPIPAIAASGMSTQETSVGLGGADPSNTISNALPLARSFVEGQTFGLGDEIGLGMASLAGGLSTGEPIPDVYRQMRQSYDERQRRFREENPKADLAANITGGLFTAIPGASKLMSMPWAQAHPAKAASLLGAGGGALGGTGYAKSIEDIPKNALLYGGIGSLLGPFGYAVGRGLGGLRGLSKRALSVEGPQKTAARTAGSYLADDAIPAQNLADDLSQNPLVTIADVGGPGTKGAARQIATIPSRGQQAAKTFLSNRQKGSFNRVMGTLRKLSGGDTDYFNNMKSILTKTREAAKPLYDEAAKQSVTVTDDLSELFTRPSVKAAIRKGSRKAADEGIKVPANIKSGDQIDFKTFDYTKRALDDKIGSALRSGNKDEARVLTQLKNELLDVADDQIPAYAQARAIYSEGMGNANAMELGKKILRDDFDDMLFEVQRMSKSEQDSFINGATKAIRDKLISGREDKNAATRLATIAVRERLRNVFPDDDTYRAFIDQLDLEDRFAATYQQMFGGSQTQPRQVAADELAQRVGGGDVLGASDPGSALMQTIRKVTGSNDIPDSVTEELARIFFTPSKKLTAKDLALLRRFGINAAQGGRIKGLVPSIIGAESGQSIAKTQQ